MARHLFHKVDDGPWKDVGSGLLEKYASSSEESIVADLTELSNVREGPMHSFEVREVPNDIEGAPSGAE